MTSIGLVPVPATGLKRSSLTGVDLWEAVLLLSSLVASLPRRIVRRSTTTRTQEIVETFTGSSRILPVTQPIKSEAGMRSYFERTKRVGSASAAARCGGLYGFFVEIVKGPIVPSRLLSLPLSRLYASRNPKHTAMRP